LADKPNSQNGQADKLTTMNKILALLEEGDLRSIGNVPIVVEMVQSDPLLFGSLIENIIHEDPGVRMRASDAVEKITRRNPEYLGPYKNYLLHEVLQFTQQEVRWHMAQIIPRLNLTVDERHQVVQILFSYLEDSSKIVQTNSLQALVELASEDDELFLKVRQAVEHLVETGSPAVKNRAEKLLPRLVRK